MARPSLTRPRAARRAAERAVRAEPGRGRDVSGWRVFRRMRLLVWGAATIVLLALAAAAIERKVTWYLAVDQLGYLLFARDLLHGKIFHDWVPANVLASLLPERTDVLAQTYIWDQGRLYSRYAPGFPLVLAAWTGLFGDAAAHALNPVVFLALLGVLIGLEWRVHRSLWRGTALAVLMMICPTGLTLWALTPTRDLTAHLCGFIGLLLLAGRGRLGARRALGAALSLGYAISVRPDAVLYLLPAGVLALSRWWPHRDLRGFARLGFAGVLGLAIGLAPSLAYYGVATGDPFVPTQSMEAAEFLAPPDTPPAVETPDGRVGYPPGAWRGTTLTPVSGGGLKLEYLSTTLPGNWAKIHTAYGDVLLGFAACGLVVAGILRPAFALALGSYLVAALLFYSCWARPYGRYLVSVWLLVPVLIVEGAVGTLDLVRYLYQRRGADPARHLATTLAVLVLGAYLIAGPQDDGTALLPLTRLLVAGSALALGAAAVWPTRRIATVAVPGLVLALVALGSVRLWNTLDSRAPFQRQQAERSTAVVKRSLVAPAVVITTEDAGRPLENLEYYADVRALYLTDLARWHLDIRQVVFELLVNELEPYLLIPRSIPEHDQIVKTLQDGDYVLLELVEEVPPQRAYDFFATPGLITGGPLELWHIR
jgi:hypothetical protein